MEDTEIVDLFFARSENAISETANKYGAYLKTIAGNILSSPEDGEEVLNDVYLAAWNSIPPKRPVILKYYLSRIVRNLCFKKMEYLSAEKRNCTGQLVLSELEECIPDDRQGVEQALDNKITVQRLNTFLGGLPREDRKLFLLRYYYALPLPQLAEEFGCSLRQVKYRLEKLRCALKNDLQKEGIYV